MQPQGIDMSAIREALERRSGNANQMTPPSGALPTGGSNVPVPAQAPPMPANVQQNVTPGNQGAPVSPEGAAVAKAKSGMSLDDDGKNIAKQLINKLMQVM